MPAPSLGPGRAGGIAGGVGGGNNGGQGAQGGCGGGESGPGEGDGGGGSGGAAGGEGGGWMTWQHPVQSQLNGGADDSLQVLQFSRSPHVLAPRASKHGFEQLGGNDGGGGGGKGGDGQDGYAVSQPEQVSQDILHWPA